MYLKERKRHLDMGVLFNMSNCLLSFFFPNRKKTQKKQKWSTLKGFYLSSIYACTVCYSREIWNCRYFSVSEWCFTSNISLQSKKNGRKEAEEWWDPAILIYLNQTILYSLLHHIGTITCWRAASSWTLDSPVTWRDLSTCSQEVMTFGFRDSTDPTSLIK